MPVVIPLAHDFICPWCWIGFRQAQRLAAEFDIEFAWQGYELFPDELEWPEASPLIPESTDRPPTPSRLDLAYAAENMAKPHVPRPPNMRSHFAHEAVAEAQRHGTADALLARLYPALWEGGLNINDPDILVRLAAGLVPDLADFRTALIERRHAEAITGFDDPAYATGIYNVPTFRIGGARYAEAPTSELREALIRAGVPRRPVIYPDLRFPSPPVDRPYVLINMVTTIDGKIITGKRDEPVMDLGSALDHATMRTIEGGADAVMLGAGALRATPGLWYPPELNRYVVTTRGVPYTGRFFTDVPERAWVVGPETLPTPPDVGNVLRTGRSRVNLRVALRTIRQAHGVRTLLVEGGSELNAQLLRLDLVDELFLTLAPKTKLGRTTPTYAGGTPLSRAGVQQWSLVQERREGNEVFLRYRRDRGA